MHTQNAQHKDPQHIRVDEICCGNIMWGNVLSFIIAIILKSWHKIIVLTCDKWLTTRLPCWWLLWLLLMWWFWYCQSLSLSLLSRSRSLSLCPVSIFGGFSSTVASAVNSAIADNLFSLRLLAIFIAYCKETKRKANFPISHTNLPLKYLLYFFDRFWRSPTRIFCL